MFTLILRFVPGPLWLRIALIILVLAGLIALLLFVVFPWFDENVLVPWLGDGDGSISGGAD